MDIAYRLVGYDRQSERPVASFAIASPLIAKVKRIAGFRSNDDGLGDYPLDARQTGEIGRVLQIEVEPDKFDYLIEPYVRRGTSEAEKQQM